MLESSTIDLLAFELAAALQRKPFPRDSHVAIEQPLALLECRRRPKCPSLLLAHAKHGSGLE